EARDHLLDRSRRDLRIDLAYERCVRMAAERLLRRGEQRETVLELAASLRGHEVREVLRHAVAWPLSVPRGLSRLAHRGEEGEGVFGVHRCGSFHEVLDELAEEEVLLRVMA